MHGAIFHGFMLENQITIAFRAWTANYICLNYVMRFLIPDTTCTSQYHSIDNNKE